MPPKMDMPAKKAGRPRKADDEGTAKQQKQREYMRRYVASINEGIKGLAKDEEEFTGIRENGQQDDMSGRNRPRDLSDGDLREIKPDEKHER